jgi:hypothetical protein
MGHSRVPEFVMMVVVAMIVPTGYLAYVHYHSIAAGVLAAVAMPAVALVASWVAMLACVAAIVPPAVALFWCLNRFGLLPQPMRVDDRTGTEERAEGNEGLRLAAQVLLGVYAVAILLLGGLAYLGHNGVAAQIFRVIVAIAGTVVGTGAGLVGIVRVSEHAIGRRERMPSTGLKK